MKKILFISFIIFVLSSMAFAFDITYDGITKEYTGPSVTLILEGVKFNVADNQMPPVIIEGRTLVPVREVFEMLGGSIRWNAEYRIVSVDFNDSTIELTIDSKLALVNGEGKSLDVPAKIINNKTMVPVRFISENAGLNVDWNSVTKTISIGKSVIPSTATTPVVTTPEVTTVEETPVVSQPVTEVVEETPIVETVTIDESNLVDDIDYSKFAPSVRGFNEKYTKTFGENRQLNGTYQLCEAAAQSNMLSKDHLITIQYIDLDGKVTISDNSIVITELKNKIIKTNGARYTISGKYNKDTGLLSVITIKRTK